MDDELVLLTSYFNLSGGRRQDTADTFRVEPNLTSATAPDGSAAVYIVTEASTGGHMGPRARRRAADVVAWEYASHGDDPPPTRLKVALRAAHEAVRQEFDGHVAVGLSVMAVERDTVYLGQVAPAQVYVLHEGGLHSISANADGSSPFARALGTSASPQITVFRDRIGPGDVVALCSSWFHRSVEADDLRECFGGETADDIAEGLLELAKQQDLQDVTAIVIEAVRAEDLEAALAAERAPSFMEQVDTAVQALANVGRMFLSELRPEPAPDAANGRRVAEIPELSPAPTMSRVVTTPGEPQVEAGRSEGVPADSGARPVERPSAPPHGITPRPPSEPEPAPEITSLAPVLEQATDEVPIVPMERTGVEDLEREPPERASGALPVERRPLGEPSTRFESRPTPEPKPASELEQVNSRIQSAPGLGDVIPPVQAFPEASTEPERIYATNKDIQAVNKRPRRFGAARREVSAGPTVIRPPLADLDLSRPPSRPAPPALIWFVIAAVLVLAVASIALFLRNRGGHTANPYPHRVRQDIALATSAKSQAQQELYLGKARKNLALAQVNGATAKQIRQLAGSLRNTTDQLHHVTRVTTPVLLSNFGRFPGAQPTELASGPNNTVYVLDSGRKDIFSVTPSAGSNPTLITNHGDIVNGFTIGTPLQIATDGTTVLALDDHDILVRDSAGTKTAASLPAQLQNERIVAMTVADPDVYLLDAANNQIWRYAGAVSYVSTVPQAFWTSGAPNLKNAVSLAFDGTSFYILDSHGSVLKSDLMTSNPQTFHVNLPSTIAPLTQPVSMYTAPGLNFVWIADPAHTRILQLDKSGNYIRTYRSTGAGGMSFSQLKSVTADPKGTTLYAVCGTKLFDFPVRQH